MLAKSFGVDIMESIPQEHWEKYTKQNGCKNKPLFHTIKNIKTLRS
jgi:hypothetical protein